MAAKKQSDLHYHTPTLTRWFAISSIALVLVIVWAILDDHKRQWKQIQQAFLEWDAARTEEQIEAARAEIPPEETEALENRLWEARDQLAAEQGTMREMRAALQRAEDDLYRVDQEWRNAKAYWATARYEYEQAQVHESADIEKRREEYEHWTAEVTRWIDEVRVATRVRDETLANLESFTAGIRETEKQIAALETQVRRLETKLETIRPWWGTRYVLNEPILDMMAPSLKIRQAVVEIEQDMIFTSIERVDRCMTCHMAINRPGYEDAPQPYASHPRLELFTGDQSPHPMEKFGCTTCHFGRDRSVDFARATHHPADEEQRREWEEKWGWHPPVLWDFPMLPAKYIDATCFKCHIDQDRVPGSPGAVQAEDFFETFGCYGCHNARGYTGLRKAGPSLRGVGTKLPDRDWTYRWIQAPRAFRARTRMPHFWFVSNNSKPADVPDNHAEIRGVVEYLYDRAEALALDPLPAGGGDPGRGEKLVQSVGCLGCHVVGDDPADDALSRLDRRRFGPTLNGIGSKTTAQWVYNWIRNPKKLWPDTRMPDLRLTDQEALDVTAYLMTLRNERFMESRVPDPAAEARDQMLLEFFRAKLTDAEAHDQLDALSEHERWLITGERAIRTYGCFGCHDIPGFETAQPVSIELTEEGSKSVHRFDFGHLHDIPHTRQDWIAQKLRDPRGFDQEKVKSRSEYQKMPDFGFSEEEVRIGTTTVLSFVKDRVRDELRKSLDARETALEAGRKLTRERNCRGCHELEGEGRNILATLVRNFQAEGMGEADASAQAEGFAPPLITIEGAKVEPDWLFAFLKEPTTIRSWMSLRMPTFQFTDEETNALLAYFSALSEDVYPFQTYPDLRMSGTERVAADKLTSRDYFNCFACHQRGSQTISGPASQWAPNLDLANGRLKPGWIEDWLRNPQAIQPGTRMPTYFDPEAFDDSGPPDILGGDEDAQIRTITKWVLGLGGPVPTGVSSSPAAVGTK